MSIRINRYAVVASLVLGFAALATGPSYAQTAAQGSGATRAQVKMDRDTFLAMARWDEVGSRWVLRDDMPMPAGVASRAEVAAMRDKFLPVR